MFRGAGWNVIKVIWGSKWDELLAKDKDGVLLNQMNTTVDGEFQRYTIEDGAYIRDNFFGPDPRLRKMVRTSPTTSCATCPAAATTTASSTRRTRPRPRTSAAGAPTVILVQDDQGLDARPGHRGPQRDAPDQEDDQGPADRAARPSVPARRDPRRGVSRRAPAVLSARRGLDRVPVHDGAPPRARRLDPQAHAPVARRPLDLPGRRRVRRAATAVRATRRCQHHDGLHPPAAQPRPRRAVRRSASCRSSPTRRARSAWTRCSAS